MKIDLKKILKELETSTGRKAVPEPKQAALLVIDLQNYFSRIIQPVLENILSVIQSCRQREIPILFTQHGHTHPETDGGELIRWWGEVIVIGTEEWRLIPEIKVEPGDIVLPKKHYSAFLETDLDSMLQSKGVKDLIIAGVMTNLCCETTARDAFMRNYRVFFLIDGTATGKSDHHLATLKNLGYGFAYLLTCQDLVEALKLRLKTKREIRSLTPKG
ncbi:MAG: isochorismatase family protein [Thermodesulfobacteriota bacterium]